MDSYNVNGTGLTERLSGVAASFPGYLEEYCAKIAAAIKNKKHHDHRRALLLDFLRECFSIDVDEFELEHKVTAASARGLIDAFYRFVIIEIKTDLDSEREDARAELTKYFQAQSNPTEFVAVVTDGLRFEVYDC